MPQPLEISPAEAKLRLARTPKPVLIDVREPEEYAQFRVEGAELVPMQTIPGQLQRLEALADDADLLILCHHGIRSLNVVNWLRRQGVENCFSVAGGIDRWDGEAG